MHHRRITRLATAALLLTIAAVIAPSAGAQEPSRNVVTFGFGGGGVLGATYERTVIRADRVFVNVNAGAGLLFFGGGFAHGATIRYGGTHSIEAGVLGTFLVVQSISLGILGPAEETLGMTYRVRPLIGYRRQPLDGGLVVRLYFSPYFSDDENLTSQDNSQELRLVPWGGLMFGFSF